MNKVKHILFGAWMACCLSVTAQTSGTVFNFLALPYSAAHNAHGGANVSLGMEGDLGFAMNNPALLNASLHDNLQLNYAYYGSSMNFAGVAYGRNWGDNYTAYVIHYLNYGSMPEADIYGNLTGRHFSANDVMFEAIYARQLGPMFRVGASLKPVYSKYETYSSFALGADVGAYFTLPDSTFQMGLTLQNIGWQLKGFYSVESGQKLDMMPLNLQLGISYKLAHAPLRFSLTIHNMQRWNMAYATYNDESVKWLDNLFRHTVWSVDILPKKNVFWATLSYNHRRHMDLKTPNVISLSGFSLGTGIHVKSVRVGVAVGQLTRSNFTFQATLNLDINELMK